MQYHIFSPYRVCPLGAHVDHQKGLVTGFAIDKGVDLCFDVVESSQVTLRSETFTGDVAFDIATPTLVKQAQKFPRGAGIHPVAPAIDSPNFLVQNAVEACGLDRDVACNERYAQATEPRAYGLVVPVMRRKENAPIAHLPENRGSTFRKAEFQTALSVGVRCGIGGQPLERGKTEKQIARMARHIEYKTTIKLAGIYIRNSSRDMAQVRIDDTALPPRKAEQGACAPRKKCGCCSAEEVHCAYNIQSPGSSGFGTFTESIQKQREQQQSPNGHPQGGIVNKSVIISTETFVPPLILGPCVVIIGAEYKQVYIR